MIRPPSAASGDHVVVGHDVARRCRARSPTRSRRSRSSPTLIITVLGSAEAATCTVSIWLGAAGTGVRCGSLETVRWSGHGAAGGDRRSDVVTGLGQPRTSVAGGGADQRRQQHGQQHDQAGTRTDAGGSSHRAVGRLGGRRGVTGGTPPAPGSGRRRSGRAARKRSTSGSSSGAGERAGSASGGLVDRRGRRRRVRSRRHWERLWSAVDSPAGPYRYPGTGRSIRWALSASGPVVGRTGPNRSRRAPIGCRRGPPSGPRQSFSSPLIDRGCGTSPRERVPS